MNHQKLSARDRRKRERGGREKRSNDRDAKINRKETKAQQLATRAKRETNERRVGEVGRGGKGSATAPNRQTWRVVSVGKW